MFLVGSLKGFPALGHFLPNRFEALRGFLGGGKKFRMLVVGMPGPRLQLIRILPGIRHLRADVAGALRGDALGRGNTLRQGGQVEPQLLGGLRARRDLP